MIFQQNRAETLPTINSLIQTSKLAHRKAS